VQFSSVQFRPSPQSVWHANEEEESDSNPESPGEHILWHCAYESLGRLPLPHRIDCNSTAVHLCRAATGEERIGEDYGGVGVGPEDQDQDQAPCCLPAEGQWSPSRSWQRSLVACINKTLITHLILAQVAGFDVAMHWAKDKNNKINNRKICIKVRRTIRKYTQY